MEMIVTRKNVFGHDLIYPVNETAKLFARLTGKKTFAPFDITIIKQLGYTVVIKGEEL